MQKIRERSLMVYFLDLDFDLPPILALQMAYGFLAPPLRFNFVTQLSNILVLRPFFFPCGIFIIAQCVLLKLLRNYVYLFLTLIKPTHIGIYDFDDHNVPLELVHC
jgi:hypothetical protein